jgi:hypothetical protein
MRRTGCKMCINQDYPDGHPRKVVYTGTVDQIEEARILVAAVIVHGPNALSSPEQIAEVTQLIRSGNFNPMGVNGRDEDTSTASAAGGAAVVLSSTGTAIKSSAAAINAPALSVGDSSSGGIDVACKYCLPSFRHVPKLFAIGACNHRDGCSVCMFRKRSSGNGSCPTCSTLLDHVVCTTSSKARFVDFKVPGQTPPDYQFHPESKMYFPRQYFAQAVAGMLLAFVCRDCQTVSKDLESYRAHYQTAHGLSFCELCATNKKVRHAL